MRALHFVFAFSLMTGTNLIAEKPFDFASTPGKLPKNVVPQEYAIRITPNVETRTFTGTETIKLSARESVKQLVLNAAEIKITKASVDGKAIPASAVKLDEKEQTLTLSTDALPAGNHQLDLDFTGK